MQHAETGSSVISTIQAANAVVMAIPPAHQTMVAFIPALPLPPRRTLSTCSAPTCGLRVGVVGAGTSGAAAALLLQRQGHNVTLFERASSARLDGCGVQLRGGPVDALETAAPDVAAALDKASQSARSFVFKNMKGKTIRVAEPEVGKDGGRTSMFIWRPDVLANFLGPFLEEGGVLKTRFEANRVVEREGEVEVVFENGEVWQGDLVLGADGIRSRVAQFVDAERNYHYLGDMVWRGTVKDDDFVKDGQFFVYSRINGIYANAFDLGENDAGESWTHWGVFKEGALPSEEERKVPKRETIPKDVLDGVPPDFREIVDATESNAIVQGWSFDIDPLRTYVKGRVALLGDAAHAMCSTQAWGMGSGIDDAVALANFVSEGQSLQDALRLYEEDRFAITQGYQKDSRALSEWARKRNPNSTKLSNNDG